ncbi:thymidylate kinase [Bacteroides sp. CAG:443]|nr:thymidylate kinase [Bacteroides sp. CAG:443]
MSNLAAEHIANIIGLLNSKANYAVLRNFEGLPDHNKSRDIDIIITKKSYKKIKNELVNLIDRSGWKIVTYLYSDRLITYVCAYQTGEKTEIVQWDFFVNTSVFGILLMDADEFLVYKKFNGFLYYVDVECQFLDKYLYNRVVGSQYPEKYRATREKAEHTTIVEQKIRSLFGSKTVALCDKINGKKLLWAAICWNLKCHPICFLGNLILFLWTFWGNYLRSNTGFSIGFTGPDGSGKTTIIDLLLERLAPVFRTAHKYYHFRPTLFGNLGEVAHSAGLKKEVDRDYSKPHRGGKTGALSSFARLLYYSLDYIIGYFVKVKTVTRITRIVIFDRYYTDIICDSRRSRIYLNYKFLYGFGKLFIPSLDYNILLTAGTDTILARKKELDEEGIRIINKKIDYLAGKKEYKKVLNEQIPEMAVAEILSYIFEEQHKRNLQRLK